MIIIRLKPEWFSGLNEYMTSQKIAKDENVSEVIVKNQPSSFGGKMIFNNKTFMKENVPEWYVEYCCQACNFYQNIIHNTRASSKMFFRLHCASIYHGIMCWQIRILSKPDIRQNISCLFLSCCCQSVSQSVWQFVSQFVS